MPILSWLTRDEDIRTASRIPYRLLEEVPDLSAGGEGETGNILIQGDNLEALKALLPFYAGRVKCIYIDPPYNTQSAFEHYDDNLEHTQWLAMIWPRLEMLRDMLSEDGSIYVSIDDNEGHYLKVITRMFLSLRLAPLRQRSPISWWRWALTSRRRRMLSSRRKAVWTIPACSYHATGPPRCFATA